MKPLMPIGDLMSFGFKTIKETWRPTLKYTIWFFLSIVIYYAVLLGFGLSLGVRSPGAFILFNIIASIALIVGLLWILITLYQYLLDYTKGHDMRNWQAKKPALSFLPGLLWLFILMIVPMYAAFGVSVVPFFLLENIGYGFMLGAILYIAAFVFAIWWGLCASQSTFLLIEDDMHGVAAIKQSMVMVKGRWWSVFLHLLIPQLVFQLIISALVMVYLMIGLVIGLIFFGGFIASMSGAAEGASLAEAFQGANLGLGLFGLIFLFVYLLVGFFLQMAAMISSVLYQAGVTTKLFHQLKETK